MQPLLLDTHAAIWITRNESLAPRAVAAMNAAHQAAGVVFVSPITAWEVGLLVSRNRLNLLMTHNAGSIVCSMCRECGSQSFHQTF
jgi:PIN domain nuclease of toxin-antitoxin system